MIEKHILKKLQVQPGAHVRLAERATDWSDRPELKKLNKKELKKRATEELRAYQEELCTAQELLWASDLHSILIVLQAMDAAGKDGIIKHVMSGVNPQGCEVHAFKQPSAEELNHNFLWRYMTRVPERGRIGIFNRSYYEEVLVVKVHPAVLGKEKLPPGPRDHDFWKARYEDINAMERHLTRNGTKVLKFFLHISKKAQKKRFLARLDDPTKNWKFSDQDLVERDFWDDYQKAFEDCFHATSSEWAPWHIIPADSKPIARALVASVVATAIQELDLRYPELPKDRRKALELAKARLKKD